jgi:predicted P-loop ATPase
MQITYLPNIRQSAKHHTIQIADYFALVRSGQHLALIEAYRNTKALSKDEQAEAKQRIPAVTISGTFKDNVSNANLTQHSGLICIDFDAVDDVAPLKSELAKDPYTFAALLSVSGNGLAALVKIEPERHLDAFNGLKQYYFKNYGQLIDQSCKNVSRLRFLSYDPLLYVNESAKTFKEYPKKEAKPKQVHTVLTGNEFDELIDRICRGGYDLTEGAYKNYLDIGFALASEFGERGREYFHAVAGQNSKYDHIKADRQYNYCLRDTGQSKIAIGTFYYYAKQSGVELKSQQAVKLENIAKMAKKQGRAQESVVEIARLSGMDVEKATETAAAVFEANVSLQLTGQTPVALCQLYLQNNHQLHYNTITADIEDRSVLFNSKPKILDDMALNTMYLRFSELTDNKISFEFFCRVIYSELTRYYNPFEDFLKANESVQRSQQIIDELAACIETTTPHVAKYLTHWGVGMIASVYGHTSPLVLVLAGERQNTGKTEFFRRLLPKPLANYYAESKLDGGKDDDILLTKKLIIMDDEFGGKSKFEAKRFKELTSKASFSIRLPYGRTHRDLKRLAVLAGTTNDLGLISDPTGNRRILPINVLGINHPAYNAIDKTALFMAFYDLYQSGFNWHLSSDDILQLNENSSEFNAINFEAELINQYFRVPQNGDYCDYLTNTELKIYLEVNSQQRIFDTRKLGMEMKNLGFQQVKRKVNGSTMRCYAVVKIARQ